MPEGAETPEKSLTTNMSLHMHEHLRIKFRVDSVLIKLLSIPVNIMVVSICQAWYQIGW